MKKHSDYLKAANKILDILDQFEILERKVMMSFIEEVTRLKDFRPETEMEHAP